jgi:predicted RNA-binding protein with PIN domain
MVASIDDLDLLLIDGDNLLHDVRGSRDEGGVAWLLPRLSGWRPRHLRIVVGLDGHPAPGEASRKKATRGIEFHYSGRRSADDLLIDLLKAQPFAGRSRTAVVTRDRGLQARASRAGGQTRSVDWLMREVSAPSKGGATGARSVSIGQGKPAASRHYDPYAPEEADRAAWQPGRGATKKRGNPRRSPKGSRQR